MGETKAGKTTLLATAAEYLWETYGKVLFLYTCELGGFSARVEQAIRRGIIRPFRMRTRDDSESSLSFETLQLASKGYVPIRFLKREEGVVETGIPMISPVTRTYHQTCTSCGHTRSTTVKGALSVGVCACKRPWALATSQVTESLAQTKGFERIGGFAFDGLTSMSDWYLQDMSHRNLGGEAGALQPIQSGDIMFRGNNRAQVGMAQTRIHELVANSLNIPFMDLMPIWTAITCESTDESGRLAVVGPKLAGDAKTYIAPSWFGNCLEAAVVEGDKAGEVVRRLFLTAFTDPQGRRHLCGHRGDPRFMPGYIEDASYSEKDAPQEYCTGFSLKQFYTLLEESVQRGLDTDALDGPGLDSIPDAYGEAEQHQEAKAAPSTQPGAVRRGPSMRRGPGRPTTAPPAQAQLPAVEAPVTEPQTGSHPVPAEDPTPAGSSAPAIEADTAPAEAEIVAAMTAEPAAATADPLPTPPVAVATQPQPQPPPPPQPGQWARPAGARPPRAPMPGPAGLKGRVPGR